jgi:hypothetical protein
VAITIFAKLGAFLLSSKSYRAVLPSIFGFPEDLLGRAEFSYSGENVCEVVLCSLCVRHPRQFGACWLGSWLWQELQLDEFFY